MTGTLLILLSYFYPGIYFDIDLNYVLLKCLKLQPFKGKDRFDNINFVKKNK